MNSMIFSTQNSKTSFGVAHFGEPQRKACGYVAWK